MDLCANLGWLVDPWNETHIVRRGSSAYQECGQRLKDDGFNCDRKTLPSTVVRVLQLFVWHFMVSKSFSKHQQTMQTVVCLTAAFVCRSFAQFPWTTFLYLSKSAKHQDLTNVQMSRIGSCDQRRNSDIWFWHIEVCLGLVEKHINMTREMTHQPIILADRISFFLALASIWEVLYKCFTDPHHHYPPNKISKS